MVLPGVEEADVEVDGRRWHYYAAGDPSAPPVLLIHGFRSSARFFAATMLALSDRWRTVAPDLPGHGDSEPWDPEEDVVEQWILLEGFLKAVDLDRMAILGISRGGAVGLQLAAHSPDRVTALVLIAAPTKPFKPGTLDIRQMVVNHAILDEDLLRELGRTMMASNGYEAARSRAVEANTLERDLRGIMDQVRAPTLIVWGAEDRTIPVEMGLELLEGIPGATLRLVGGAGHLPLLEQAEEGHVMLRSFLDEHYPGRS